jgi:hypothetical protein
MILVSAQEELAVKAVVRHCASGIGGFYLGAQVIPRDNRRSDREPMYCAAEISCTREGRRAACRSVGMQAVEAYVGIA